jgi:ABC-2 type transport system permease protein
MFQRMRQMLIKEFTQVLRDPRMRMVIFVIPAIQTLVIGYAVTIDVEHVPTAVVDLDRSVASRDLVARFVDSRYFDLTFQSSDIRQAGRLMDHGDVSLIVQIHHGFSEDLQAGRSARVQLIVDGTDSNTAAVVLGYAGAITSRFSSQVLLERMQRSTGRVELPGQVEVQSRAWFNENLVSRNFYVPGVIVIVVSLVTLLLTSMAVVREKEIGTIEQIMVTPIRPMEFVLGKTVPFALIGLIDVAIITVVGVFWFDVPVRGSVVLLFGCTCLYLLTMLGVGLLISTVSSTQQQAMMGTFFFFFPAMLLSGFVFPVANMPQVVQWLTYANPLCYFLVIVRGIFLKGIGPSILWPQIAVLAVMGVATLSLAVGKFHKTIA